MLNSALTKFNVLPPRSIDNANGLVAWWTFDDGTATDWSGKGNNGLLGGTVPTASPGIIGSALQFNSASKIDLPNIGVNGNSPRTLSAWINPSSISQQAILGTGNNSGVGNAFTVFCNVGAAGNLYLYGDGDDWKTAPSVVTINKWYHFAVCFSGGVSSITSIHIYVNGISSSLSNSGTPSSLNTVSTVWWLGYDASNPGNNFTGLIDDVRVYNLALSASEINAIYNQGIASQRGYPEGEMATLRVSSTFYSLPGSSGSFLLSGSSAGVSGTRKLSANTGSFAFTGNVTPIATKRKLAAGSGAFSLGGQNAAVKAGRTVPAAIGSFALSGSSSIVATARKLSVAPASFAVSGNAAAGPAERQLPAAPGSFAISGHAAAPSRATRLDETSGAFSLDGNAVLSTAARKLSIGTGSFTLTGESASGQTARNLRASSGDLVLSGASSALPIAHKARADTGSFSINGSPSTGSLAHFLGLVTGDFGLEGNPAALGRGIMLAALPGLFTLGGEDAELTVLHRTLHPKRRLIDLTGSVSTVALMAANPAVGLIGMKPRITLTGSDT